MRDGEEEKERWETFLLLPGRLSWGWELKSKIISGCAKAAGKLPPELHLVFASFMHPMEKPRPACRDGEGCQGLSPAGAGQASGILLGLGQGLSSVPAKARLQGDLQEQLLFPGGCW